LLAFAGAAFLCAQTATDLALEDPSVLRAKLTLERVRGMVEAGTLPRARLDQAQENLDNAVDEAIYTRALYGRDLTTDQAAEVVKATQRRVDRTKKKAEEMEQFLQQGIISQNEYKASVDAWERAKSDYGWAAEREKLVAEVAVFAAAELAMMKQMEEGAGMPSGPRVEQFVGKGSFSTADYAKVATAFTARFSHSLPISANGETAVHRSMGFDHSGRIDVGLYPDSVEGQWLRHYLTVNRIPFFAFRGAVAHQATGAHIHMGPPSTHYVQAKSNSSALGGGN
jgi:hypothetical protein